MARGNKRRFPPANGGWPNRGRGKCGFLTLANSLYVCLSNLNSRAGKYILMIQISPSGDRAYAAQVSDQYDIETDHAIVTAVAQPSLDPPSAFLVTVAAACQGQFYIWSLHVNITIYRRKSSTRAAKSPESEHSEVASKDKDMF